MRDLKPLTDAEITELLGWVSACQSSYHIDRTPSHRFGGLGSHLQENRDSLVEYVNALIAARAQPAQAVPVLTESELRSILQGTNHMVKNAMHGAFWPELEEACRAIEQAVRAKMGAAVPMTDEQAKDIAQQEIRGPDALAMEASLIRVIRHAERHHGIVGKEGA